MIRQSGNFQVATRQAGNPTGHSISVQLFSSHELHHAALHHICNSESGFVLECAVHELPHDLAFFEAARPDLVIIEAAFFAEKGLAAMQTTISQICKSTAVVLLADQMSIASLRQAIASGASGYLLTSVSLDEFRRALRTVAQGGLWFGKEGMDVPVVSSFAERLVRTLSERECQILNYVAKGLTSKEVAHRLRLSQSSVRTYWYRVLSKLNALNKAEALVRAAHLGLIDPGFIENPK